jgi:hypothetical protein
MTDPKRVIGCPVLLGLGSAEQNLIQVLLDRGCRPDWLTLPMISLEGGLSEIETALKKCGERTIAPSQDWLVHPPLVQAIGSGNLEKVNLLIKYGEDVNGFDRDLRWGRSPLQIAAERGDLDCIKALLEAEADVNTPPATVGGGTALKLAGMSGNLGIVGCLLSLDGY